MNNTGKRAVYTRLEYLRQTIISMDLPYSRTTELLNQILEVEKEVDSIGLGEEFTDEP